MSNYFDEKDTRSFRSDASTLAGQNEKFTKKQVQEQFEARFSNTIGDGNASRTFQVTYDKCWKTRPKIHLVDESTGAEIYTVDTRTRNPQMRIHSLATASEVATAHLHTIKPRAEVILSNGQEITIELGSVLGMKCCTSTRSSYISTAFDGEKMTWQARKRLDDLNMVLLNGSGIAIARFKPHYKWAQNGGILEVLEEGFQDEKALEEVLIMALAVVHNKISDRLLASRASSSVVVVT